MMNNNKKLEDEQLDEVNGGTFDINKYSKETYNNLGIATEYHFWEKDKFWVWCDATNSWKSISYDQANEIVWLVGKYKYAGYRKISWETYQFLKSEYANHPDKFYRS